MQVAAFSCCPFLPLALFPISLHLQCKSKSTCRSRVCAQNISGLLISVRVLWMFAKRARSTEYARRASTASRTKNKTFRRIFQHSLFLFNIFFLLIHDSSSIQSLPCDLLLHSGLGSLHGNYILARLFSFSLIPSPPRFTCTASLESVHFYFKMNDAVSSSKTPQRQPTTTQNCTSPRIKRKT